jgi:uncharacterized protein (TIGR03437 family)
VSEMYERASAQSALLKNVVARLVLAAAVFSCLAFTPQVRAQSVLVTVSTVPAGEQFVVDGQLFWQAQTFAWAVGSGHTLVVASPIQPFGMSAEFTFQNWTYAGSTLLSPQIPVVATAGITQYTANFSTSWALTVTVTNNCGSVSCGGVPGQILLNGATMGSPGPAFYPQSTPEVLTAVPNVGYAFAGWTAGSDQVVAGVTDTVTLKDGPVTAIANFTKATPVTFASNPEGLRLVVDTEPTTAPFTESLGWGTVHNVSATSAQQDSTGNYWVFSSWSDGGAVNHPYTVPQSSNPVTLTASFTPGALNTFLTSPLGLNLTVDGRSNWNIWNFAWAVGSTHTFSAPAIQTDAQGRSWGFTGWSNGGSEAQTVTVPAPQNATYTATYQQLGQLTVNSTLPSLAVSVNGTACTTPCTVQPPLGTQLTVSAPGSVPAGHNSRQDLLGWSTGAGPGNLTLAAPATSTTVTANYHLMNQLVTATSPANAATWNLQPGSPDGFYDYRTVINLSLSPLPGYQFRNWSGDLSGIAPFGTLLMSQPRSVTALFATVPYLPTGAVTNGAGPTPSSNVAPGSAISIFGVNLADNVQVSLASPMPQTLNGVTVSIGDRLLPLYFVSPTQINAQLPADMPLGPSSLVVTTPEQAQVTASFTIAQDAPGLFALTSNKKAYALAFHQDGTLVTEASPATAGETLTLYGTGFGPTTPARPEGLAVPQSPSFVVTDPASVQVGTASFPAQSAYALPGAVGIDVVEFALASGAPSGGDFELTVTINQVVSNTVLLPIQ